MTLFRFVLHTYRIKIALVHLTPLKTSLDKIQLAELIATLTDGFNGRQIASLCNECAMIAGRNLADEIKKEHFDEAFDRIKCGIKEVQSSGRKKEEFRNLTEIDTFVKMFQNIVRSKFFDEQVSRILLFLCLLNYVFKLPRVRLVLAVA